MHSSPVVGGPGPKSLVDLKELGAGRQRWKRSAGDGDATGSNLRDRRPSLVERTPLHDLERVHDRGQHQRDRVVELYERLHGTPAKFVEPGAVEGDQSIKSAPACVLLETQRRTAGERAGAGQRLQPAFDAFDRRREAQGGERRRGGSGRRASTSGCQFCDDATECRSRGSDDVRVGFAIGGRDVPRQSLCDLVEDRDRRLGKRGGGVEIQHLGRNPRRQHEHRRARPAREPPSATGRRGAGAGHRRHGQTSRRSSTRR